MLKPTPQSKIDRDLLVTSLTFVSRFGFVGSTQPHFAPIWVDAEIHKHEVGVSFSAVVANLVVIGGRDGC